MAKVKERSASRMPGFPVLFVLLAALGLIGFMGVKAAMAESAFGVLTCIPLFIVTLVLMGGLITVQPNQAVVLIFFGKYIGSVRDDGFWYVNPLTSKRKISLRVRNMTSETIKVNDADGNPIQIGAVIVWQVTDSAQATFDVDDYYSFVNVQVETAVRDLASRYPYDDNDEEKDQISLRRDPIVVAKTLASEVQERADRAGIQVLEARISHLAYAPEIAQAMLKRQQAQAVISARKLIVEAAVSMVHQALHHLEEAAVVHLDNDKKAAMVNNLMVVLTSEQSTSSIVNTGA